MLNTCPCKINLLNQSNTMNQLKRKCWLSIKAMLTIMLLYAFSGEVQAQSLITGTVTDSTGKPMQGVSIKKKNTSAGTVTNDQGIYQITASPADVLVFSYVGYQNQEVTVGTRA